VNDLTETHWQRLALTARLAAWVVARRHGIAADVSDQIAGAATEALREQVAEWESQKAGQTS
jgi:hypothetical protein